MGVINKEVINKAVTNKAVTSKTVVINKAVTNRAVGINKVDLSLVIPEIKVFNKIMDILRILIPHRNNLHTVKVVIMITDRILLSVDILLLDHMEPQINNLLLVMVNTDNIPIKHRPLHTVNIQRRPSIILMVNQLLNIVKFPLDNP